LEKRKATIIESIDSQGKLTGQLRDAIAECFDPRRLEDYYLPYKPKRRVRATVARDAGLEPLARIIMAQKSREVESQARRFVCDGFPSVELALKGASDIIAEWISENVSVRASLRRMVYRSGRLCCRGAVSDAKYADYAGFSQSFERIAAHSYLALRRGESESALKLSVEVDDDKALSIIESRILKRDGSEQTRQIIVKAVKDSYRRLLLPSITTELLAEVKERSDSQSIDLFSAGLRQVLLAPPVTAQPVVAIDPGFRTGCKVACLNRHGDLLETAVIYPVPPHNRQEEAAEILKKLVSKHSCRLIALGDGTASAETETFLMNVGFPEGVMVERVSEQGASIYSASEVAQREFPDLDLTFRSAISIGRRLQDPLAELVKIDPKSIGVGQYQHDVNQTKLRDSLDFTVSQCVNEVGVNLNTASVELLSYVAGIGPVLAANIVDYRRANGDFSSRKELLEVPRLGPKAYEQSSGFLRIHGAENPLDNSAVHPESYELVGRMARSVGKNVEDMIGNDSALAEIDVKAFISESVGPETLQDIIGELAKPGRDPREAYDSDWRDSSLQTFEDLHENMTVRCKVVNLTAFGAFVDLGIKEKGLVHVSEMSCRRISSPLEIVKIGQILSARIIRLDHERKRIALSIKES
ncbi:MAG: helix-hairpin-helix domain-containing protein, partial [Paramuribaculum sp.]|nr:helix-hairpin-helix domain-containing protein [Paramuribaculum sp.]